MLLGLAAAAVAAMVWQARNQDSSGAMVWILALYSMSVPFASAVRTGLPAPVESVSSMLGVLAIVALVLRIVVIRRLAPVPDAQITFWLITAGFVIATALRTTDATEAWDEVVVLAGMSVLYLLATLVAIDRSDLLLIQRGTALGASVLGTLAVVQALTGTLPAGQSGVPRFEVPWAGGDPNITAASLLLPLALAAYLQRTEARPVDRRLAFCSLALGFAAIALTSSRAGLVLAVAIVLHHLVVSRRAVAALGLAAAIGVPLYLSWSTFSDQVGRVDTTGRTDIWRVGWSQCADWCSYGAGLGAFPSVHRAGALDGVGGVPTKYGFQAHNVFLELLIESGAVAVALLVVACVATLWSMTRIAADVRAAYALAFVCVLVANFFLSNLSFKYFWLVVMHGAWIVGVERFWSHPDRTGRTLAP